MTNVEFKPAETMVEHTENLKEVGIVNTDICMVPVHHWSRDLN
jgi:hypothetical protein